MQAHKVRVVISKDHQVNIRLPKDIPTGNAELIVLTGSPTENSTTGRVVSEEAAEFESWLNGVLSEFMTAPVSVKKVCDEGSIYDE